MAPHVSAKDEPRGGAAPPPSPAPPALDDENGSGGNAAAAAFLLREASPSSAEQDSPPPPLLSPAAAAPPRLVVRLRPRLVVRLRALPPPPARTTASEEAAVAPSGAPQGHEPPVLHLETAAAEAQAVADAAPSVGVGVGVGGGSSGGSGEGIIIAVTGGAAASPPRAALAPIAGVSPSAAALGIQGAAASDAATAAATAAADDATAAADGRRVCDAIAVDATPATVALGAGADVGGGAALCESPAAVNVVVAQSHAAASPARLVVRLRAPAPARRGPARAVKAAAAAAAAAAQRAAAAAARARAPPACGSGRRHHKAHAPAAAAAATAGGGGGDEGFDGGGGGGGDSGGGDDLFLPAMLGIDGTLFLWARPAAAAKGGVMAARRAPKKLTLSARPLLHLPLCDDAPIAACAMRPASRTREVRVRCTPSHLHFVAHRFMPSFIFSFRTLPFFRSQAKHPRPKRRADGGGGGGAKRPRLRAPPPAPASRCPPTPIPQRIAAARDPTPHEVIRALCVASPRPPAGAACAVSVSLGERGTISRSDVEASLLARAPLAWSTAEAAGRATAEALRRMAAAGVLECVRAGSAEGCARIEEPAYALSRGAAAAWCAWHEAMGRAAGRGGGGAAGGSGGGCGGGCAQSTVPPAHAHASPVAAAFVGDGDAPVFDDDFVPACFEAW